MLQAIVFGKRGPVATQSSLLYSHEDALVVTQERSSGWWQAQCGGDPRKRPLWIRDSSGWFSLWFHPHAVSDPVDFAGFDLNTSLPLRPALKIADRHSFASDYQHTM